MDDVGTIVGFLVAINSEMSDLGATGLVGGGLAVVSSVVVICSLDDGEVEDADDA